MKFKAAALSSFHITLRNDLLIYLFKGQKANSKAAASFGSAEVYSCRPSVYGGMHCAV